MKPAVVSARPRAVVVRLAGRVAGVAAVFGGAAGVGVQASAADFAFFGRSGDGIALDFSALPGVAPGATFSNLTGLSNHVTLTSDQLGLGSFGQTGELFFFANNAIDFPGFGDTNPDAPGFQGTTTGTVDIDGVTRGFSVTVQPGYTGSGRGAVTHNFDRLGGGVFNDALSVARQQQRLAYFEFQREGGGTAPVTGIFDTDTDEALRTFQAAFVGGLNTTQASVDGIVGPNTAGWLNAGNAPRWERLEPDANISSVSSFEPYATSWATELARVAAADAKADTGDNQRVTALSTLDGYGSSVIHNTHRAGMDIDLGIPAAARNTGNGFLSTAEATAADYARAFIDAHLNHPELDARVSRILNSNVDIIAAVNATHPGVMVNDTSGGHASHFHIDVTPRFQAAAPTNLLGDFNLDDTLDAADIDLLADNLGGDADIYNLTGFPNVDQSDLDFLVTQLLGGTAGDANLNGTVEQGDLDAVLQNWGQTDSTNPQLGWASGDLNGNGQVEQGDLDLVLQNWGNTPAPNFDGVAVPEPGAALVFATALFVSRQRAR